MQDNENDTDDKYLSDLYSELSREEPSRSLDEKILSEARNEVATQSSGLEKTAPDSSPDYSFRKKGAGPFSGNWGVPVSLAAVIVLSVTVVFMIEKERPYSLTSEPESSPVERAVEKAQSKPALKREMESKDSPQQKIVVKKKEKRKEKLQIHDQEVLALQRAIKPQERLEAKTKLVEAKPKPEADTASSQQIVAAKTDRDSSSVVAQDDVKQSEGSEQPVTEGVVAALRPSPARKVLSAKSPQSSAESSSTTTATKSQVQSEPSLAMAEAVPAESEEVADADEATEELEKPAPLAKSSDIEEPKVAETQQQETVGNAAASVVPESPAAMMVAPAQNVRAFAGTSSSAKSSKQSNCSILSVSDCLASRECVLELDKDTKNYQCRAAVNQCESNFIQANDTQEICDSRPGCKFQPANCFCPPDVECVCGGGTPAMCVPDK